jgi:hypothetical protein
MKIFPGRGQWRVGINPHAKKSQRRLNPPVHRSRIYAGLLVFSVGIHPHATFAEVTILPQEVQFTRADQEQRIVVESESEGRMTGDQTSDAKFISSNKGVAVVSENGNVRAVGDGEAVIRTSVNGQSASVAIKVEGASEPFSWNFRNHIQPVLFKMGCSSGACHGAAAGKNGFKLSLRGYDFDYDHLALTREAKGRRVSLAQPEESLILLKATHSIPHEGGERFEKGSPSYKRIVEWIRAGAKPASDKDPIIERIEVLPKEATLIQDATQQVLVQAHYSDGSIEEVTEWAKFGTTDENVAVVDEQGLIKVVGTGSTAITAWYSSKLSFSEISVPRSTALDTDVFAKAERANFIDDLVLEKLESLNIAPAERCDDATFIRRAYLDTIGILPTPEEVNEFVSSEAHDKRAKRADALLERPEFVDYWAYKWSDLFLLSSKNLPKSRDLNAFYRFIRESVKENKPWDRFATEILTAKGSTQENGAAGYFLMHKETTDLVETTSQAFLGMSITCARCHNHPLEKWTQNDYYGMANLFARVKLKNGKGTDDTDVQPKPFGDIVHPKLGEPLPPKPLDGEPIALDGAEDRRDYLAEWMTSPENPYFTRAIVNRVWTNYMGRGLVDPEDDLRLTNPPSNEKLLAALAKDLVEHDYDLKHLMRNILNSAAYNRSSEPSDPAQPDRKYYSQYILKRLPAEIILDAYAQVTEVPTPFSGYPDGFRATQLRDSQVASYFLTAFGRPERNQTCSCERTEDANIAQTLHIANGSTLNDKLRNDRCFLTQYSEGEKEEERIVGDVFMRALSRPPTAEEKERAVAMLEEVETEDNRREAIEDLAWAVLSSKEFLFNH